MQQQYDAAGGSLEHVALKLLVGAYLERRQIEYSFEHPLCGFYPDVLSKDTSIVIECGHTQNSEKLIAYFLHGKIKEFIQVPYPNEAEPNILGYQFVPKNSELHDFLKFIDEEKRTSIKNIFKSRSS